MKEIYRRLLPLGPAEIEEGRKKTPQVGYPSLEDKLYIPTGGWQHMVEDEEIVIPEGPWSVTDHPNRQGSSIQHLLDPIHTIGNPMSEDRTGALASTWAISGHQAGRPLPPTGGTTLNYS